MKFYYRTTVREDGRQTYRPAAEMEPQWCCDRMKKHFDWHGGGGQIQFGNWEEYDGPSRAVTIARYSYEMYEAVPIQHCPFCGERIEVVEAERYRRVPKTVEVQAHTETEYEEVQEL